MRGYYNTILYPPQTFQTLATAMNIRVLIISWQWISYVFDFNTPQNTQNENFKN